MDDKHRDNATGTWRQGEHVLISDVLMPLHALVVWFGLFVLAIAVTFAASKQSIDISGFTMSLDGSIGKMLVTISLYLVLLFFLWRIARRVSDESLIARYRPAGGRVILLAGLSGVALAIGLLFALSAIMQHTNIHVQSNTEDRMFVPEGPWLQYPLTFLTVGIVAPFVEEFYFRGVLLSWFDRKMPLAVAALVTSAIFGIIHFRFLSSPGAGGWLLTLTVALVGLSAAVFAIRTRSLWPGAALHATYNTTVLALAFVAATQAGHPAKPPPKLPPLQSSADRPADINASSERPASARPTENGLGKE